MWRGSTWRGSMPYPRPWDLFRKSLPVAGGFRKATYVRIPRIAGYAGRDNVGLGHWKTWVTGRLRSLEDLDHWKTRVTGRQESLEDVALCHRLVYLRKRRSKKTGWDVDS